MAIETKEIVVDKENLKAYPTILQGWGVLLLVLAANFLVAIPLVVMYSLGVSIHSPEMKFIGYSLPMALAIWFTAFWWRKNPKNRKSLLFASFPLAIVPYIVVMTLALMVLIELATGWVPMPGWLEEMFKDALPLNIWGFITVALAAPLLEEMLMRGVVLEGLLKNYKPGKAILWSAILFGVMHLNPWQFVAGLMSGLIIGWLYWRSQSLWPGIIVHFINNALAFWGMIYYPEFKGLVIYNLVGGPWLYAIVVIACMLAVWLAYRAINGILDKKAKLVK